MRAHLKSGSQCTIWNRSSNKPIVTDLKAHGARYEEDLVKAIERSQFLVLCLPDHERVYECFNHASSEENLINAFAALKAVINLSNGTPGDAETMASWVRERGAQLYISGAIMAGPDNIGDEETAFILYSGEVPSNMEGEIKDMIFILGRPDYVGPAIGNAQLNNNASLAATYSLFAGVMLSSSILAKANQGTGQQSGRITKPFQSYVTPLLRPAIDEVDGLARSIEDDNEDAQGAAASMISASLRNLSRTCKELGVDGSAMDHLWKLCSEVVNDGDDGKGMVAVAKKMMKRP